MVVVEGGREGRWKIRDSGLVVKTTSVLLWVVMEWLWGF